MPTHSGPNIIEDGLVLSLDAGDKNSYPLSGLDIEYLIVAGGGGGGTTNITTAIGAGGGGAGGVVLGSIQISKQSHSVIVGAGGAPTTSTNANNGTNSSVFGKTALGGGGGGNRAAESGGASGGSGGGSAYNNTSTNPGQATQPTSVDGGFGNDGGFGPNAGSTYGSGGGGGGAGSRGRNTTPASQNVSFDETKEDGAGGDGILSYITGNESYYGGGGGAGRGRDDSTSVIPPGGIGGGGNGGGNPTSGVGVNGESNTGGGGGGGASSSAFGSNRNGGNGGSGIVVIRYKGKQKATGGDLIYRYKNYTVHVFENSDNFVVGNTITDITGNQNPATLQNGVGSSTDNLGVFEFDGVDDYLKIDSNNKFLFNTGDSISIECWVNCSDISSNTYQAFFTIGGSVDVLRDRMIQMRISQYTQYGYVDMLHRDSNNTQWQILKTSSPIIQNNNWYHIVGTLTYGTGSTWIIYVNGVEISTTYQSGDGNTNPIQPSDVSLYIGAGEDGSGEYMNGKVAMIKLYNRSLTPQEVKQNFNATKSRFGL